jgi:hypothetical protein
MASFEFQPIHERDLPELAVFLRVQQAEAHRTDPLHAPPSGDDMRWLLDNPDLQPGSSLGEVLRRKPDGELAGMILAVPRAYYLGGRRQLGLAAGNFYVDSSARMQGFFMLRRFMATSGYDFLYANSCNSQSGPLWTKCGGVQVPESDVEYLFPFRLGPLVQEVVLRKSWPKPAAALARAAGALATPFAAPRRPKSRLKVEPCADWERLSTIAERDRDPGFLDCERGPAYLRWVYGGTSQDPSMPHYRAVHVFSDERGNEGWFALNYSARGQAHQIRAARLVDVVWPRREIALSDVLAAMIHVAAPQSDVLSIRGRPALPLPNGVPNLRRRTLPAPEAFLVGRTTPTAQLVPVADFPFADRY